MGVDRDKSRVKPQIDDKNSSVYNSNVIGVGYRRPDQPNKINSGQPTSNVGPILNVGQSQYPRANLQLR